jgi:putative nucleotidyltransferase with HDIG domain
VSQFATKINDTTVRVAASLLKPGMFVCRLDRPWLGTPFLMQGFLIQSESEVRQLRDLCDQVYVDTEKSLVNLKSDKSKKRAFSKRPIDESLQFLPSIDRDLARHGIRTALPAYTQTMKSLRQCFKAYSTDQLVSARAMETQVNQCLDAVMQNTTAMAWLSRVKSHNQYTSEHSMHVSLLAMVFAIHCGWSREEARKAGLAGLLFDLGKTRVPKQVLNKPGPLSESEWQLIHDHPKWGRYFLEKSGFHQDVINAAYYHHERPDGTGYPVKRMGNQTPNLARLIRILDAYDAMISYRPYAQQRTVFEATKVLYRGRGTEFDTQLVDQFIAMIGVFPVGTIVELSSGEIAVIIGQNNDSRLLPKISIVRDRNKNPVKETVANLRDIKDADGNPRVRIKSMLHDGAFGVFMQEYTRQLVVG